MKAEFDTLYNEVFRGFSYSYKVSHLTEGFEYRFRVSAVNAAGESVISDPSDKIYTAFVPSTPPAPIVVKRSSTAITLEWDDPESNGGQPLTGFHVYRSEDGSDYTEISMPAQTNAAI